MEASFFVFGYPVKPWVFSLVVLGLFSWELTSFWLGANSSVWPWVRGTVIDVRLTEDEMDGQPIFKASVTYTYVVRGKTYEGNRLAFVPQTFPDSEEKALSRIQGIYAGKIHRVYYKRSDPEISALKPGVDGAYCLYMVFIFIIGMTPLLTI